MPAPSAAPAPAVAAAPRKLRRLMGGSTSGPPGNSVLIQPPSISLILLPGQIIRDHEVLVGIVRVNGLLTGVQRDHGMLVALTNAGHGFGGHQGVTAPETGDRQLAAGQATAQLGGNRDAPDGAAVDETVGVVTLHL